MARRAVMMCLPLLSTTRLEYTRLHADVHATRGVQNAENVSTRLLQGPVIA